VKSERDFLSSTLTSDAETMRILAVTLVCFVCTLAAQPATDSIATLQACSASPELLKFDSMNVGVRFATSNSKLANQFANAMNFWAAVIDMQWHIEPTSLCSLQLFDGQSELFEDSTVAKAHLVDRSDSSAWIAFNPKAPLTNNELYLTAIHEMGHLLGLSHNPNVFSVMYYTNGQGATLLDETDLRALAKLHKLRRIPASGIVHCTAGHSSPSSLEVLAWPRRTLFVILREPSAK
jgi:hypothetical protein